MDLKDEKIDNTARTNAFYSTHFTYWFESRIQKDKALLYISSGALGFFGNFFMAPHQPITIRILACIAMLFFAICAFLIVNIFSKNSDYLEKKIDGSSKEESRLTSTLQNLDTASDLTFCVGIVFSILLFAFYAFC